jgi:hypothetical protein
MVMLSHANTRMKDFYDVAVIDRRTEFDGAALAAAIAATLARRATPLPSQRPHALTRQFSEDATKSRQWQAFLNKNRITADTLSQTISLLDLLLWPPTLGASSKSMAIATWRPQLGAWV